MTTEAVAELQEDLECTNWDVVQVLNSLDEYTGTVTSYIDTHQGDFQQPDSNSCGSRNRSH